MYEPHLLQLQVYSDLLGRLGKLSPSSQAVWGKMDVARMLAHVTAFLELGMTNEKARQTLMGRVFGSKVKRQILTKGVPQNLPTIPRIKISDSREFQKEKKCCGVSSSIFIRVEKGVLRSNLTISLGA